jgi:phosphatidylserine/phosphatidylglycerophosphate/cardiolipin synthase-like enzyme
MTDLFSEGSNCWKTARARRASVLVDGENYFRCVRQAMAFARERIMLIGWDFDARTRMFDTQGNVEGPLEIGDYLDWLVEQNPDLHVYIVQWQMGMLKMASRGATLAKLARWKLHPRIHLRLDDCHPVGAAQHEKIVAIDEDVAFCGGIDITKGRWDTREHAQVQQKRETPDGEDLGPWHDVAMVMQGDAAGLVARLAEERWMLVAGQAPRKVTARLDCWPEGLPADFEDTKIAISRTRAQMPERFAIREIEQLYCDAIAQARQYIYIESQYFTARRIAAAIARRLQEPDGPECVIVTPVSADGWLEPQVMDSSRARLFEELKRIDNHGRLRLYHPLNEAGEAIYVHAKVLIVDDRLLRIGSSNISNRSLGFDTECDVTIDAGAPLDDDLSHRVASIRNDLLAEHLDCAVSDVSEKLSQTASLIDTISLFRKSGRTLRDYQTPDLNQVQEWLAQNDILDPGARDDDYARIV